MAKYKAYPEYKYSGVEWLGLMPKSWTICRLKNLATIKNGQDYKSVQADDGYPVMGSGGQFTFASKFMYDKPSVLLGRKGTIDKPLYINEPFWTVDTMYYTELNEGFDAKYLHYLALTIQFSRYSTNTALPSMTQEHLSNYKFSVPKAESERKKITEFLDLETAKIDNLIEKQQILIELLKEKRQAVISHAVTKGLNPDVTMKDSGVEWLGEVPAHWKVSKLKYLTSIQGGFAFSSDSFTHEGVQILRIGNLYQNNLELERQPIFLDVNELDRFRDFAICKDDILMSLTGTLGKRDYGFAIKVDRDDVFLLNQRVAKITPDETRLCRDFLLYILWSDSYLNQLYSLPSGTKQANLSNSNVTDILVACPAEISEQKSIIEMVIKQMEVFDSLMDNSLNLMESLQERRTALISAAVTGKIDVRDWVPPETQDIEETQEATA
ncbi:restriction endonuclease subunit S [Pantoea eucalypti]|jgi:type I restriction enzyme S subunit|uniref:restriction endonuclease subunit S n=1 Tax=Pantoea eucalypti TaxID=470933 RepID=UPI00289BEDC9|nr:restriction endonuclease subunit S [Pantoea eucalypti]